MWLPDVTRPRLLLFVLVRLIPLMALGILVRPLTFRPAPGSQSTKHLTSEWRARLDKFELILNGGVIDGFQMETELSQAIVVTDTYLALAEGRPVALDREFCTISEDLKITYALGSEPFDEETVRGTSDLEGSIVQFRVQDGAPTRRFDPLDRTRDPRLLNGLREDMDLRVLLPPEPVTVGDTWEIELAALPDLLSPGGYFGWTLESQENARGFIETLDPALMGELRHAFGSMLEGHVSAHYAREENERSRLDLTIDVETEKDVNELTDLATQIVETFSGLDTIEVYRLDLTFALKAVGSAEWDTVRGQVSGLQLAGEVESTLDLELHWNGGSGLAIRIKTVATAEFEQTVQVQ